MSDIKAEKPMKKFRFLPLTLRIETKGGIATTMILRGTPLPAKRSQVFSTASDNQTEVEIVILMGESPIAHKNLVVGNFHLKGIPPAPQGVRQVLVTFEIDSQCKVKVHAAEKTSQKRIEAELQEAQPDLSDTVIEKLLRQAEIEKDDDQRLLKSIEVRNSAEQLICQAEAYISQQQTFGLHNELAQRVESALAQLGLNLETNDLDNITQSTEQIRDLLGQTRTPFDDLFESFFGGIQPAHTATQSSSDDLYSQIFGTPSKPLRVPNTAPKEDIKSSTKPSRKDTGIGVVGEIKRKFAQNRHTSILAVFANPRGSDPLRLGAEDRVIRECLRLSQYRDTISLDVLHAATIHDVRRAMLDKEYRIVQFSGHGTGCGLALEDEQGKMRLIPQEALAEFLSAYSPPIECVVLNACYSKFQGQLIAAKVPYVVGMAGAISDEGATEFTRGFYDALGAGKDIEFAHAEGCRTIKLMGLHDGYIPMIFKRRGA